MKPGARRSLWLAYYGDDFTGSTDVMESLARAGLRTVLFLRPPTRRQLAAFPGLRAFGIAGGSRAMSPAQMRRELPGAFKALKASGAPIVHYKTCSTFDSSPSVGSIGKAIELGRAVFGENLTPLIVGAPILGRYVAFGNLFARSGLDSEPFRLDRHPTMSRHPVTPMNEADLRLHLGRQTGLPIELVDLVKLNRAKVSGRLEGLLSKRDGERPIVLFDTTSEEQLPILGRWLAERSGRQPSFVVGSSGIEYALVAHWRQSKRIPTAADAHRVTAQRGQIITVSGSCSPVTDRQIGLAVRDGFVEIACDSRRLADRKSSAAAVEAALNQARRPLAEGRHIIFQTARGPADVRRAGFSAAARRYRGRGGAEQLALAGTTLGQGLASILEVSLQQSGGRQAIVCGGDTSTHVARALGIEALEYLAPVAPGAPLCKVHAPGRVVHGREIIFKGGQVGRDSFFVDFSRP